jgi:hypothetical protein
MYNYQNKIVDLRQDDCNASTKYYESPHAARHFLLMRATGHRITRGERIDGERSRGLGALGEFVE